jgi:hypothetical protein
VIPISVPTIPMISSMLVSVSVKIRVCIVIILVPTRRRVDGWQTPRLETWWGLLVSEGLDRAEPGGAVGGVAAGDEPDCEADREGHHHGQGR